MPIDFDDEERLPPEQFDLPLVCVRGEIAVADFSASGGLHRFGGPLGLDVRKGGPLQRVLTLSLKDPMLADVMPKVAELPLVYGFTFNGCRVEYRVVDDGRIEVVQMTPGKPSRDWPYARYPAAFPQRRFGLRSEGRVEPDRVSELAWQGVEHADAGAILVAIVPPNEIYGVSLWGEDGDAEGVQVVFEVDPATGTVTAYNQCT
jgi:hypothetical protein